MFSFTRRIIFLWQCKLDFFCIEMSKTDNLSCSCQPCTAIMPRQECNICPAHSLGGRHFFSVRLLSCRCLELYLVLRLKSGRMLSLSGSKCVGRSLSLIIKTFDIFTYFILFINAYMFIFKLSLMFEDLDEAQNAVLLQFTM